MIATSLFRYKYATKIVFNLARSVINWPWLWSRGYNYVWESHKETSLIYFTWSTILLPGLSRSWTTIFWSSGAVSVGFFSQTIKLLFEHGTSFHFPSSEAPTSTTVALGDISMQPLSPVWLVGYPTSQLVKDIASPSAQTKLVLLDRFPSNQMLFCTTISWKIQVFRKSCSCRDFMDRRRAEFSEHIWTAASLSSKES